MLLNDNFWKWFGNSKMKTKDGTPIIFYHTTYNDFDVFEPVIFKNGKTIIDKENGRQQYYFTKHYSWAKNYANEEFSKDKKNKVKILEVYLKCDNPLVVLPIKKSLNKWLDWFQSKNIDITIEDLYEMTWGTPYITNDEYMNKRFNDEKSKKYFIDYILESNEKNELPFWKIIYQDKHKLVNILKKAGYDSIIIRDTNRGQKSKNLSVIVFESNQIKSINNNGDYSMEKNNINEAYILNEKFSMDNWTKKDFDKIIDEIIKEENPNLDSSAEDSYEISLLNLPQEVKDLILADYITKEKPRQDAHRATYQNPKFLKWYNEQHPTVDWGEVDAWYVIEHPYARKYIEKFCMNEFKKTYNFIESLGNPMTLYRFVHFDYNRWVGNTKKTKLSPEELASQILRRDNIHLGVCWTPHWEKAVEFGHNEHNIDDYCMIIEAKVPRDAVNLPNTLMKRSQLTYYHYEDEIELIKGSKIYVEAFNFYNNHDDTWFEAGGRKYYKV